MFIADPIDLHGPWTTVFGRLERQSYALANVTDRSSGWWMEDLVIGCTGVGGELTRCDRMASTLYAMVGVKALGLLWTLLLVSVDDLNVHMTGWVDGWFMWLFLCALGVSSESDALARSFKWTNCNEWINNTRRIYIQSVQCSAVDQNQVWGESTQVADN